MTRQAASTHLHSARAPATGKRRRSALHRHHPHAGDRCGAESAIRACRHADGIGAGRLHAVAGISALRPRRPAVGEPRPLRALQRPRLDAALCAAASRRRAPQRRPPRHRRPRGQPRRHQELSPARQRDARPPGIRPHHRRGSHHRPARPGLRQQRRHGDRLALARRALQPAAFSAIRLRRLHDLQRRRSHGRRRQRGGLARRPSRPRQSVLDLRQQHGHHRGPYRPCFQRGRRKPVSRLSLERVAAARRQRHRRAGARAAGVPPRRRSADHHHRRQHHRLRRAA